MQQETIAKILTAHVFGVCSSEPQTGSMIDLFENCKTACGGYSYVLRSLLEYLGYQTRYANMHNIPQQGNHTAVEVLIEGEWAFLDPTFGAFFSENGEASGPLMSLSQIVKDGIKSHNVFRVRNRGVNHIEKPLDEIFTNEKDLTDPLKNGTGTLLVSSYLRTEQIEYGSKEILLPLEIPIVLDGKNMASFGTLSDLSFELLQEIWLTQTNERLNDEITKNDVSFNTSFLYNNSGPKITFLRISNLQPKTRYNIFLNFFTNEKSLKVQITNIGKYTSHNFSNPV